MKKDRVLKLLEAADWRYIILRLTRHAIWRFRRYSWKSGIPKGCSPEDIANNAIMKVFDGTRNWDPDKYPDLLKHLIWIVNSDIEHLFSSLEHQKTGRMPLQKDNKDTEVDLSEIALEHPHSIMEKTLTPEEELIAEQDKKLQHRLIDDIHTAVKGDDDLEFLFLCFEEGIDKPHKIAAELGWNVEKVYNLKKKLLRRALKIDKDIRIKEE